MKGLVICGKLDSLVVTLTHLWFQMQLSEDRNIDSTGTVRDVSLCEAEERETKNYYIHWLMDG